MAPTTAALMLARIACSEMYVNEFYLGAPSLWRTSVPQVAMVAHSWQSAGGKGGPIIIVIIWCSSRQKAFVRGGSAWLLRTATLFSACCSWHRSHTLRT